MKEKIIAGLIVIGFLAYLGIALTAIGMADRAVINYFKVLHVK